ncbi:MAG: hypothetical protein MRERV_36c014 [Mycoplasmataceae bacterium RV_VA103A]|nr:MAG: hypothetical protein MRERV_36c014 [Mycoplasmataceae bacterium RV_VA103A]
MITSSPNKSDRKSLILAESLIRLKEGRTIRKREFPPPTLIKINQGQWETW